MTEYLACQLLEDKNNLWDVLETPFIEDIFGDDKIKLVTFLYRFDNANLNHKSDIYLYSSIVPFLSEESKLKDIPGTDINYLTLTLPNTLRTTYSFICCNSTEEIEVKVEHHISDSELPIPMVLPRNYRHNHATILY